MGLLLWTLAILLCFDGSTALLKEDGVYVRDAGKGQQVVATWNLLVSIKHPDPPGELYTVYMAMEQFKKVRDVVGNVTFPIWMGRLDVIMNALETYTRS